VLVPQGNAEDGSNLGVFLAQEKGDELATSTDADQDIVTMIHESGVEIERHPAVYEGKGGCRVCHSIGREGGSTGPDLSDVGRRRDLKYLNESLVSPEADVPGRYRAIQVVPKSGPAIAGLRLNEDDISIQLRDEKDNFRSFFKDKLSDMRYDKPSLMPAYGTVLSKKEIDDVVSYLSSLRGVQ
jgi:putative heme-binding domain-containing protein